MKYKLADKYASQYWMSKIMGPNPLKLTEELLFEHNIPENAVVCDLGSGNGVTSVFLAKEYAFKVYATDLWSNPEDNSRFFKECGLDNSCIVSIKADATKLPFKVDFFDAVISVDSYNYFGRDTKYLNQCLYPFVKKGGYLYICVPGMVKDCHDNLPPELLLSWTKEQMDYMHDIDYWRNIVTQSSFTLIELKEMETNAVAWNDWLMQENEYAVGDRKSMNAGAGKYLNFIKIVMRKE